MDRWYSAVPPEAEQSNWLSNRTSVSIILRSVETCQKPDFLKADNICFIDASIREVTLRWPIES
ncbi:hypothetical protein [Rubripirellula reticaptiva]|uniref:Uncharacterized protein n=1 Tax=Rubripirellula reticaptiva TaxID=2528013 RepID=A0A5C6FCP9_9BACT|nr:hypothetical protein [Rubripirellula reticaptiva]TWU58400.1 hypothetical protein Poly59_13110 [Rubripirellula reticaptiva]